MSHREGLAQLLSDPEAGRIPSYVAVQDSPAVMSNHEEAVQNSESECRDSKEVHCRDSFAMILQERLPTLCGFRILRCPPDPTRNSSFRKIEPKLEQFSMNARSTPGGILIHHTENQLAQFLAGSLSAEDLSMVRNPIPVQEESGPMPPHNSLGSDDNESLLPLRPQPFGDNPEQPIKSSEPRPRISSLHGQKLLAKGQIFQQEITSRMEESPKQTEQEPKHDQTVSDGLLDWVCGNC